MGQDSYIIPEACLTGLSSIHDRGIPFKFTLGQVQEIKGWDQAIKTMKKGVNALFTIPPNLAYGVFGSHTTIPGNATIQFDVQLLSWNSVKDICKDGGILKKIIKKEDKWENTKDHDEVLVKYEVQLEITRNWHTGFPLAAANDGPYQAL